MKHFKIWIVVFLVIIACGSISFAEPPKRVNWPPPPNIVCHLEKHTTTLTSNGELFQVDLSEDSSALYQVFEQREYQTGHGYYWYPVGYRLLTNGMVVVETEPGAIHKFIWVEKICEFEF